MRNRLLVHAPPARARGATLLLAFPLALTLAGCGRGEGGGEKVAERRGNVDALPADADPCTWIAAADVERLLGKLDGQPRRGKSAENPEPMEDGKACVYTLAKRDGAWDGTGEVAIQVDMKDATTFETGFGMAMDRLSRDVGREVGDGAAAKPDSGWDYTGGLPGQWVGRVGHMAVIVGMKTYTIPDSAVERLAATVRDRVPDRPVTAPRADANARGGSPDPCALLTRAEVEAVVGKLAMEPYRSRESTPLADGKGKACSYYRGRHRVLVVTPTWSDGKESFRMLAGIGQGLASVLGGRREATDTLDGPWDQVGSGTDGELYFLKGDRMLEVQYRIAGVDAAAATRIAAAAMKGL